MRNSASPVFGQTAGRVKGGTRRRSERLTRFAVYCIRHSSPYPWSLEETPYLMFKWLLEFRTVLG
jgi:hypothetical protein